MYCKEDQASVQATLMYSINVIRFDTFYLVDIKQGQHCSVLQHQHTMAKCGTALTYCCRAVLSCAFLW